MAFAALGVAQHARLAFRGGPGRGLGRRVHEGLGLGLDHGERIALGAVVAVTLVARPVVALGVTRLVPGPVVAVVARPVIAGTVVSRLAFARLAFALLAVALLAIPGAVVAPGAIAAALAVQVPAVVAVAVLVARAVVPLLPVTLPVLFEAVMRLAASSCVRKLSSDDITLSIVLKMVRVSAGENGTAETGAALAAALSPAPDAEIARTPFA